MTLKTYAVQYGPDLLTLASGAPAKGVGCVITNSAGTRVPIYQGPERGATIPQPVLTDDVGALTIWVDPGSYTVTPASSSGVNAYAIVVQADTIGGGGGGGTDTLAGLGDVSAAAPVDTNLLGYVGADSKWEPRTAAQVRAGLPQSINAQADNYTLVLADAGKLVTLTNAGSKTLTVPTNASVAFPIGTTIDLAQLGAGQYTVAGAGGVTVNHAAATAKFNAQYSVVSVIKVATDTWLLVGDLAAS